MDNSPTNYKQSSWKFEFPKNFGSQLDHCPTSVNVMFKGYKDTYVNEELDAFTNGLIKTQSLAEYYEDDQISNSQNKDSVAEIRVDLTTEQCRSDLFKDFGALSDYTKTYFE